MASKELFAITVMGEGTSKGCALLPGNTTTKI